MVILLLLVVSSALHLIMTADFHGLTSHYIFSRVSNRFLDSACIAGTRAYTLQLVHFHMVGYMGSGMLLYGEQCSDNNLLDTLRIYVRAQGEWVSMQS